MVRRLLVAPPERHSILSNVGRWPLSKVFALPQPVTKICKLKKQLNLSNIVRSLRTNPGMFIRPLVPFTLSVRRMLFDVIVDVLTQSQFDLQVSLVVSRLIPAKGIESTVEWSLAKADHRFVTRPRRTKVNQDQFRDQNLLSRFRKLHGQMPLNNDRFQLPPFLRKPTTTSTLTGPDIALVVHRVCLIPVQKSSFSWNRIE